MPGKPTLAEHLPGGSRSKSSLAFKLTTMIGLLLAIVGLLINFVEVPKIPLGGTKIYQDDPDYEVRSLEIPKTNTLDFSDRGSVQSFERLLALKKKRDAVAYAAVDAGFDELLHRERDACSKETESHLETVYADSLLGRGDLERAIAHLETALALWPGNPWANIYLHRASQERRKQLMKTPLPWPTELQQKIKGIEARIQDTEKAMQNLGIYRVVFLPVGEDHLGGPYRLLGPDTAGGPPTVVAARDTADVTGQPFLCGADCDTVGTLRPPCEACEVLIPPDRTARLGDVQAWDGDDPRTEPTVGRSTVIAVGVDNLIADFNDDGINDLQPLAYAARDAQRLAAAYRAVGFESTVLTGARAEAQALLTRLTTEVVRSEPGDELVLYFAGHGVADHDGTLALALNIHVDTGDGEGMELVPATDIEALLAHHAGTVTVIVDACRTRFHGNIPVPPDAPLGPPNRTTWLFASRDGTVAVESHKVHGGIFTHVLLKWIEDRHSPLRPTADFETWAAQTEHLASDLHGVVQQPQLILGER